MTSQERHELRYQRRKAKRLEKRKQKFAKYNNFDWVFSYKHLYTAYRNSRKGVRWKASVQRYSHLHGLRIVQAKEQLKQGRYKSKGFHCFYLRERGKIRFIRAVTFEERVVQRCYRDYCLEPVLSNSFIYDNGACQTDKGQTFEIKRLRLHLTHFIHVYGPDGFILLFDFKSFFDSILHELCKRRVRRDVYEALLLKVCELFIDAFGDRGLGLGSCVSQSLALASADSMDHYIKDRLGIQGYGRYMDDGYILHKDKAVLQRILADLKEIADALGLKFNDKKTMIVKLRHGFKFMQKRIFVSKTGKICMKVCHGSIARERRKLKKYKLKVEAGKMSYADIYQAYQSWEAYALQGNAWNTVQRMRSLYNELFLNDERFSI